MLTLSLTLDLLVRVVSKKFVTELMSALLDTQTHLIDHIPTQVQKRFPSEPVPC